LNKYTFPLSSILFLLGLLFYLPANAKLSEQDQHTVDSLKKVVEGEMHDTFKLKAMRNWSNLIYYSDPELDLELNERINQLCLENLEKDLPKIERHYYLFAQSGAINMIGVYHKKKGDYEKAIDLYLQSMKISESINNQRGISMSANSLGNLYSDQGDYLQAKFFYQQGLEIDKELGNKSDIASSYVNLGQVYMKQGNNAQAIDYYLKSLKIQEELDDIYGMALSYVNIGLINHKLQENETALEYLGKAKANFDSLGYKYGSAACLTNMGNIFQEEGDYDTAIKYQFEALELRESIGDKMSIAHSYANLGSLHKMNNKWAKAEEYFNKSLKIREELEEEPGIAFNLSSLGKLKYDQKNYEQALDYAKRGLEIGQRIGDIEEIEHAAKILWLTYKAKRQYDRALSMHELYIDSRDSINSSNNQKEVIKKQAQYEFDKQHLADSLAYAQKQEMDAMMHKSALEKEANQRYLLYSGIAALVIIGLILMGGYLRKKKDNQLIKEQKQEVETQKQMVEQKNEEIIDSINYAQRIQRAILPPMSEVEAALPESFVFYRPKDIVAGDFYWMKKTDDSVYIAAADCTGHGVPGAMVSVICNSGLNRSVMEFGLKSPAEILDKTRELVIKEFEKSEEEVKDGMDIALCRIETNKVSYAGANNPLWLIRNGEMQVIKADKQPIGKYANSKAFSHHEIEVQKGDVIYLFSDGFPDQFGGEKGKKYMSARFKRFLLSIHDHNLSEQGKLLESEFLNWIGGEEQLDDICVVGVKI